MGTTGEIMSVQDRRRYDRHFKRNAVLLTAEPGRTISDVAEKQGANKPLREIQHIFKLL